MLLFFHEVMIVFFLTKSDQLKPFVWIHLLLRYVLLSKITGVTFV